MHSVINPKKAVALEHDQTGPLDCRYIIVIALDILGVLK